MAKWINLNDRTSGAKLKAASFEGMTHLFLVGMSNLSPAWHAAKSRLGFEPAMNGKFLMRRNQPGEKISPKFFHPVWPFAALEDMEQEDFLLDLERSTRKQPTEESRAIADDLANARRLGRNVDGHEVYQNGLGRFVWRDRQGATYESTMMRPALVLRAPDAESLDQCADGFVQGMRMGEVQHSEDLDRFLEAVYEGHAAELDEPARRARCHAAIDSAITRFLAREFDTAQDAYGESVRLYELLPPYSGPARGAGAMPVPLSVIAQRLLGDTSNKQVAIPNAFDGAAFSFLPRGTKVRAFKGSKDMYANAAGLTEYAAQRMDVQWEDEFVPAREIGSDALFFNADPARDRDGARSDYRSAMMALRVLADGGRAVLVLAADDPRQPGFMSEEFRLAFRQIALNYQIEEAFEVGGHLAQRVGTRTPLRLMAVRNLRPSEQDAHWLTLDQLPTANSWDEVKARVDDAIARAKVREAESESVDVDRAVKVNQLQAPYIAFSKVGESRTMVPKNLQGPLQSALAEIEALRGPVDEFVTRELGLGENTLPDRFGPEQVDALAIMINRLKKSRGVILADETGIGKGRTLAGLCTWASKQGRPVVFITDRANLFSDMARDMRDIGEWGRFRPIITNADGHIYETVKPVSQAGDGAEGADGEPAAPARAAQAATMNMLAKATPTEQMSRILADNVPLEDLGANIIFSTYSQIAGEDNPKATWIKNQLKDALLIVDEAHVAAGSDSSMARQISEMTNLAWNCAYSSATWAKSERNLHIYARALPESVNIGSLTETMKRSGTAFSEVFSSMLARDGGLIRREHDLSRLEFVLEIDPETLERNRRIANQVSAIMGQLALVSGDLNKMMVRLSRSSVDALKAARSELRNVRAAQANVARNASESASIFSSSFGAGSMLYQVQRRMNAALNVDNTIRLALRAVDEDRKPVIVFDDTGESFVRRAIEKASLYDARGNAIRPDIIATPTLRDLLHKLIEDLVTIKVADVTYEEVLAARKAGRDIVAETAEALGEDGAGEDAPDAADGAPAAAVDGAPAPAGDAAPGVPAAGGAMDAEQAVQGVDAVADVVDGAGAAQPAGQAALADPADQAIDVDAALAGAAESATPAKKPKRKVVRRVAFHELPNLSEASRAAIEEGIKEITRLIDTVPELPLSVPDALTQGLKAQGLRVGEISGRSVSLEPAGDGRSFVRNRLKSKAMVSRTVDAFNSGAIDVTILNRSGATGLSLHASPRFLDHRRRELIEVQPPENPTERVQLYGRVNRYDQLSFPRISIAATGIPGETRHLMMQNKKLASMSANVRSSRESHAIIGSVVDLLNPIGKEVCRQFLLDNPLYATHMAIDLKAVEEKAVDAASVFTRYISLLPVEVQDNLYEQVNQLFEEAVLKAELSGENPLKPREHDWRAETLHSRLLFGIDHGGLGSAFDGPVFARVVSYKENLNPMNLMTLELTVTAARQRLIDAGVLEHVGTMLNELRTPIVRMGPLAAKTTEQLHALARSAVAATKFINSDSALEATGDNPVKRAMARKLWIEENLPKLIPGARIGMPHSDLAMRNFGQTVPHVVVDVTPPRPGRESIMSQWKITMIKPGQERPVTHSLSSLMSDIRYVGARHDEPPMGHASVQVGGDFLMHANSRPNQMLISAFEHARRGTVTRTRAILSGNMYLASEFAMQAKLGQNAVYTDERGIRQRAVLLDKHFDARALRHMPVRVWVKKAVSNLLMNLTGSAPGSTVVDENGKEQFGAIPHEARNTPGGVPSFLLYTSFSSAWQAISRHTVESQDQILVVPGVGLVMSVGSDQAARLASMLTATQKKIRGTELAQAELALRAEEARRRAAGELDMPVGDAPAQAAADALADATDAVQTVAEDDAPTEEAPVDEAAPAARGRRRSAPKASDDPAHVVIGGAGRGKRVRAADDSAVLTNLTLKADTPAKMRRAIAILQEGLGLQLYVKPNDALGALAQRIVREDLLRRLREEIGDNPEQLAKLDEQISRIEADEAQDAARDVMEVAQQRDDQLNLDLELVEVNGEIVDANTLAAPTEPVAVGEVAPPPDEPEARHRQAA